MTMTNLTTMKTFRIISILSVCAIAAACNKSNTCTDTGFTVKGTILSTKAPSLDATGAGSFSEGDKISLFFNTAGLTIYSGYTFGEKNYWNDLEIPSGTSSVSATGCYPAVPSETPDNFIFDCSTENGETDFLAGEKVQVSPFLTQSIEMSFKHILHKLSVSLEASGDGISAEDLKGATVSCSGVLPKAAMNLLEGTAGKASGTPHEFRKTGDKTHFITPPQATDDIKIKISVAGRDYTMSGQDFSVNGQKVTYLYSGQTLSVKIKVSKSSFSVIGQTIGSWTSQGEINGEIEI